MPAATSYPAIVADVNAPISGTQWIIDPAGAGRVTHRPIDYGVSGQTGGPGGHYAVAQRSGEIAATLAAAAHLARIRWTDAAHFCVVHRIKVGISFSAAVTTAVEMTMRAIKVTGFTVDFTTNMTSISMGASKTNMMRGTMAQSLMGANGPGICTTAALSGQTMTADAAPFAIAPLPTLAAVTATGTAVALPVGQTNLTGMVTLYEHTALGAHPLILAANEGVILQNHLAGPASGTFALYTQWEWSEVLVY